MKILSFFFTATLALILSGCQSTAHIDNYHQTQAPANGTTSSKQHVSGFLSDYSKLKKTEGIDGQQVLRWTSPNLKNEHFTKILLEPVQLLPIKDQAVAITQQQLTEIKNYFDTSLRQTLSSKYQLTNKPGSDVAQVKLAITGIQLTTEGMKATEILPYGAVIGLVRAATDTRNKEVSVVVEMEVANSENQQPLLALVRMGQGENIKMIWDPKFSLEHVKTLLNEWVDMAAKGFSPLIK